MARYAGQPVAGSGTIATHSESDAVVCVKRSGGTSVAPNALKGTEKLRGRVAAEPLETRLAEDEQVRGVGGQRAGDRRIDEREGHRS